MPSPSRDSRKADTDNREAAALDALQAVAESTGGNEHRVAAGEAILRHLRESGRLGQASTRRG